MALFAREPAAMKSLASWYSENSQSGTAQFIDAKPAPALLLATSSYYVLMVTARSGNFVLVLDDQSPGSIPSEQLLGALNEQPATVFRRAVDTALWYANKNLSAGELERGKWYLEVVNHVSRYLNFSDIESSTEDQLWKLSIERSRTEPSAEAHALGIWRQTFARRGDWAKAVHAGYLAGDAAERAAAAGDTRFVGKARDQWEIALEKIPAGETSEFEERIRERLSRLG